MRGQGAGPAETNMKPDRRELRRFGITAGIAFCLAGSIFQWLGRHHAIYLFFISGALLLCGAFAPLLLGPVQKVLAGALLLVSWALTRLLLIAIFYLVVTPLGLLARLCGKDYLGVRGDPRAGSYWISRKDVRRDKSSYEKRFSE